MYDIFTLILMIYSTISVSVENANLEGRMYMYMKIIRILSNLKNETQLNDTQRHDCLSFSVAIQMQRSEKRPKNNTNMIKRTSHSLLLSTASSCQTHWTQMPKTQMFASIITHKFVFLGIHGCALMKRKTEFFDEAWTELFGPGIKVTDVSLSPKLKEGLQY